MMLNCLESVESSRVESVSQSKKTRTATTSLIYALRNSVAITNTCQGLGARPDMTKESEQQSLPALVTQRQAFVS
jgi:hypothetical protein